MPPAFSSRSQILAPGGCCAPTPGFYFSRSGVGLRIGISNKFPDDVDAPGGVGVWGWGHPLESLLKVKYGEERKSS